VSHPEKRGHRDRARAGGPGEVKRARAMGSRVQYGEWVNYTVKGGPSLLLNFERAVE